MGNNFLQNRTPSSKKEGNEKERSFFIQESLEGDTQIHLGRTIFILFLLNRSSCYSDEMTHGFEVELITSIIEELKITPEIEKK